MSVTPEGVPPRPVRSASALLAVGAALAALDAGESLAALHHVGQATDAFRAVADSTTVADVVDSLHSSLYYNVAAGIVLVLLLAPLHRVIRKPSRRVRMFTWVLAAVAWAMLGCGIATGPDDTRAAPSGTGDPGVLRAWSHLLPGWYTILHSVTVLALLAGLTAVALLLTRSTLQDFYSVRHQDGPAGLWSYVQPRDDTAS